jgi:general secretion pathway protein D
MSFDKRVNESSRRASALRARGGLKATAYVVLMLTAGCATTGGVKRAQQAEDLRDYDLAVARYTKVLRAKPTDRDALAGLDRSKLRAAEAHLLRGRRLEASGKFDEALMELQLAAELNPASGDIARELRATRLAVRNQVTVENNGQTALDAVLARTRGTVPPSLAVPETRLPATIRLGRQATVRQAYQLIAELAQLGITFDPTLPETIAQIDFKNLTVKEALDALARTTQTFYKVTAPGTITVAPDTPAKRREYAEEMIQSFYIGNADPKETMEMLRIVADARAVSIMSGSSSIIVRDTPERLQAVGRLLAAVDKARPEVVIDVEIMEVDRNRLREYGLQIASAGSPGIDGSVDASSDGLTLRTLRNLSQSDSLISGLPALYYRLLKTDSSTRTLANPHLRATEGVAASAKFGERVPVPTVTFAPFASGGTPQQPITSYTYENIGVNLDITPRTHPNDDVTLNVKMDLSSVAGSGYAGLPTFANRQLTTQIRLKDGETNILAGMIRDDERTTLEGIPGLSDIPVLGRLFAKNHTERQQTDIVLTLTPHIIRVLDLTEADLSPFKVARDTSAGGFETMPIITVPDVIKTDDPAKPKLGLPPSPLIIKKN